MWRGTPTQSPVVVTRIRIPDTGAVTTEIKRKADFFRRQGWTARLTLADRPKEGVTSGMGGFLLILR